MQTRKLISLVIGIFALGAAQGAPDASGTKAHHRGDRYTNPFVEQEHKGFFGIMRARLSRNWKGYDPQRDHVPTAVPQPNDAGEVSSNATVTWIGHATVLIQHQGVNLLTDPMFSDYASPLSFAGPKRITEPGLGIEDLPPIHGVFISHDHYDHLDTATIKSLGNGPTYFVPLGLRSWFVEKGIDAQRVIELDWWDERQVTMAGRDVRITAAPSQHFSGRGLTDRNKSLWASWGIAWDDFQVWFGGDTGYNEVQFKEIGERLGSIDLAIIPIGAYEPRWFMSTIHVNPAEAVQLHKDLGAANSMAIHWGTFVLAGEGVMTPLADLELALQSQDLTDERFAVFAIGETRHYSRNEPVNVSAGQVSGGMSDRSGSPAGAGLAR